MSKNKKLEIVRNEYEARLQMIPAVFDRRKMRGVVQRLVRLEIKSAQSQVLDRAIELTVCSDCDGRGLTSCHADICPENKHYCGRCSGTGEIMVGKDELQLSGKS